MMKKILNFFINNALCGFCLKALIFGEEFNIFYRMSNFSLESSCIKVIPFLTEIQSRI